MNARVKKVLDNILESFKNKDIPQAVAYAQFPIPDIPSSKWSLLNQLIMRLSSTHDARGLKQWNAVNRYVKKGSSAIYILVPYIKKTKDENGDKEEEELDHEPQTDAFVYDHVDDLGDIAGEHYKGEYRQGQQERRQKLLEYIISQYLHIMSL